MTGDIDFLLSFTFRGREEVLSGCSLLRGNLPISTRTVTQVGREEIHAVKHKEEKHKEEGAQILMTWSFYEEPISYSLYILIKNYIYIYRYSYLNSIYLSI